MANDVKALMSKLKEVSSAILELYFVTSPASVGVIIPTARLKLLESIEMAKDLELSIDSLQSRVELLEDQLQVEQMEKKAVELSNPEKK